MAHSIIKYFPMLRKIFGIISDEINAGIPACLQPMYTLKDSSLVSLNVIKCQQIYSISFIEEHVIR